MIRTPTAVKLHAPHLAPPASELPPTWVKVEGKNKVKVKAATWEELHRRALSHEGKQDVLWLAFFSARISGDCKCRQNWKRELEMLPPDFKNYFFWSVAIHNMVNVRLGKPQVMIDEARKIWAIPSPPDPALPAPTPEP